MLPIVPSLAFLVRHEVVRILFRVIRTFLASLDLIKPDTLTQSLLLYFVFSSLLHVSEYGKS